MPRCLACACNSHRFCCGGSSSLFLDLGLQHSGAFLGDGTRRFDLFHQIVVPFTIDHKVRSEEHTSELQSLMRISYAVFCLKKKKKSRAQKTNIQRNTVNKTNNKK